MRRAVLSRSLDSPRRQEGKGQGKRKRRRVPQKWERRKPPQKKEESQAVPPPPPKLFRKSQRRRRRRRRRRNKQKARIPSQINSFTSVSPTLRTNRSRGPQFASRLFYTAPMVHAGVQRPPLSGHLRRLSARCWRSRKLTRMESRLLWMSLYCWSNAALPWSHRGLLLRAALPLPSSKHDIARAMGLWLVSACAAGAQGLTRQTRCCHSPFP